MSHRLAEVTRGPSRGFATTATKQDGKVSVRNSEVTTNLNSMSARPSNSRSIISNRGRGREWGRLEHARGIYRAVPLLRQLAGRPITIVNTEAEFVQASVQTQPLAQPERGR